MVWYPDTSNRVTFTTVSISFDSLEKNLETQKGFETEGT